MTFASPTALRATATATLMLVASFAAKADLSTSSQSTATLAQATATDTNTGGLVTGTAVNGSFSFGAFDSSTGVLTGASLAVAINGSPTLTSSNGNAQGFVTYKETASLAGFGSASSNTTPAQKTGNSGAAVALSAYGSPAVANLNTLVGTGSISGTVVGQATADRTSGSAGLGATVTAHTTTGTLTYSYLNHAGASFSNVSDSNALAIMAGTSFDVFALGGTNRTLLDQITNWTCISGCAGFTMNWGTNVADLSAGGSHTGTVTATTAGTAVYRATFGDNTAYGASASLITEELELTVTEIPEPGNTALFLAGLAALGAVSRRRSIGQ